MRINVCVYTHIMQCKVEQYKVDSTSSSSKVVGTYAYKRVCIHIYNSVYVYTYKCMCVYIYIIVSMYIRIRMYIYRHSDIAS
jgi:hypothetical protein